jgi:hypothetical protein
MVGIANATVVTWNPEVGVVNATNALAQYSDPLYVSLSCPRGYYGHEGEVSPTLLEMFPCFCRASYRRLCAVRFHFCYLCYSSMEQICTVCPVEASCAGGFADPIALPGYYQEGRSTFAPCIPAEACPGGSGTNQCAIGYEDVPCSVCSIGYYRLALSCVKCPSLAWLYIAGFAFAIVLFMFLGVWLNRRRINLAALGIGVDFAQVCSVWLLAVAAVWKEFDVGVPYLLFKAMNPSH